MAAKKDFLSEAKAASITEELTVPGVSRKVYARTLSAAEVRRITESCRVKGKKPDDPDAYDDEALSQRLIAASIVDGEGSPLIPEGREAEIEDLPNAIKLSLQQAAMKVNGLGQESAGNASGATTGDGSSIA